MLKALEKCFPVKEWGQTTDPYAGKDMDQRGRSMKKNLSNETYLQR